MRSNERRYSYVVITFLAYQRRYIIIGIIIPNHINNNIDGSFEENLRKGFDHVLPCLWSVFPLYVLIMLLNYFRLARTDFESFYLLQTYVSKELDQFLEAIYFLSKLILLFQEK